MNRDIVQGKWKQWRGRAKRWWGGLTSNSLAVFDGQQAEINGAIQERAGRRRYHAAPHRGTQAWRP